ncbi:MAG: metal ABC transporter permease [Alphaproteobacteria bacterium]|nr:metal ABC transporter permease [Alphaproteobacteria bacterium]
MEGLSLFLQALTLQAGYNAAVVAIGAGLLGLAAGGAGAFIFLRKRALVSDAVSHATLPGVGLAFLLMVALGGDGRSLAGLILGSAVSAGIGLVLVDWITRKTRLGEDAAIGAILSVFFGAGIVLLTVIQNTSGGRQAGLESFLLGSTAGMLFDEAVMIAVAGGITAALVFAMRRPMTLVAFDPEFAAANGVHVQRTDLAMMGLALLVTVIGLKVVGLILIIALLIIPAVAARFWTERVGRMIWIASLIGGLSGFCGAALSSAFVALPAGPMIVLLCFALFTFSLLFSPGRGAFAALIARRRFQHRVHIRQGLLSMAREEPIYDGLTLSVLRRGGYLNPDGTPTVNGRAAAAKAVLDEARWKVARSRRQLDRETGADDGLTRIETVLTPDQIADIDAQLALKKGGVS